MPLAWPAAYALLKIPYWSHEEVANKFQDPDVFLSFLPKNWLEGFESQDRAVSSVPLLLAGIGTGTPTYATPHLYLAGPIFPC